MLRLGEFAARRNREWMCGVRVSAAKCMLLAEFCLLNQASGIRLFGYMEPKVAGGGQSLCRRRRACSCCRRVGTLTRYSVSGPMFGC